MKNHILSKTTFMRGVQCWKSLYLNRFHPGLRNEPTDEQQMRMETGHKVGKLAQALSPGGVEVDVKSFGNFQDAVSYTQRLIDEGTHIIYEAGFQFDEVLIFTDILVKGTDGWRIYEVKSSTSLKKQYILDTAIQYYVVSKSGLPVKDISLVYVNNQYVYTNELDVYAMFTVESVLERVLEAQDFIEQTIPALKRVFQLDDIPSIDIGEYCHDPVDCDFTDYCWSHIPQDSVFALTGLRYSKKFQLYRSGIIKLDQLPDYYPLNDNQRLQVECDRSKSVHIDRNSIQHFLKGIRFPCYFLDFETYAPAVPLYHNSRPYQQIPFQYSLHFKKSKQSELEHREFLGMPQEDPRRELIGRLLSDIGKEGVIIVYNKNFEIRILKELMRDFPAYKEHLGNIIMRIKDLMLPFAKRYYYSPEMRGSYSIKAVFPVLVPGLDYSDLVIAEGNSAMYAFEQMLGVTNESIIRETRRNLLEYCGRDTLAMVRVLEVLQAL
jgi:hypothetical protein